MNRYLVASLLLCLIICAGIVALNVWQRYTPMEVTPVQIAPSISLKSKQPEGLAKIGPEEKEALLKDLNASPFVSELESATGETEATGELTTQALLEHKTIQWIYRSFYEIGDDRSGQIENNETGRTWEVKEKQTFNEVVIDKLTRDYCLVSLRDATRALVLTPKLDMRPDELFDGGMPSQEEIDKRVDDYMQHVMPTFVKAAEKYTPGPHETMPMPQSPQQVATAKAHYMNHIAPTYEERAKHYTPHPGEIMPKKVSDPNDELLNRASYIATHRPDILPTYPAFQQYFKEKEAWDRSHPQQNAPEPSPNEPPPSEE